MGLADLLLRKHTAIAKVLVPSSVAFGFFYTLNHGTNPLADAKSATLGKPEKPISTPIFCFDAAAVFCKHTAYDLNDIGFQVLQAPL